MIYYLMAMHTIDHLVDGCYLNVTLDDQQRVTVFETGLASVGGWDVLSSDRPFTTRDDPKGSSVMRAINSRMWLMRCECWDNGISIPFSGIATKQMTTFTDQHTALDASVFVGLPLPLAIIRLITSYTYAVVYHREPNLLGYICNAGLSPACRTFTANIDAATERNVWELLYGLDGRVYSTYEVRGNTRVVSAVPAHPHMTERAQAILRPYNETTLNIHRYNELQPDTPITTCWGEYTVRELEQLSRTNPLFTHRSSGCNCFRMHTPLTVETISVIVSPMCEDFTEPFRTELRDAYPSAAAVHVSTSSSRIRMLLMVPASSIYDILQMIGIYVFRGDLDDRQRAVMSGATDPRAPIIQPTRVTRAERLTAIRLTAK